jgi:hypothetical protein
MFTPDFFILLGSSSIYIGDYVFFRQIVMSTKFSISFVLFIKNIDTEYWAVYFPMGYEFMNGTTLSNIFQCHIFVRKALSTHSRPLIDGRSTMCGHTLRCKYTDHF